MARVPQSPASWFRATGSGRSRPAQVQRFIEPCHPIGRDRPPSGNDWLHEIKADGYRAQVHLRGGKATVYSRGGHDWTEQFASIAQAAEMLPVGDAVLDGEAIVQDKNGVADFHALRRELSKKRAGHLIYYVFDLLWLDGEDQRQKPLIERKQQLKQLLARAPASLLYADHLEAEGDAVYAQACKMGLEGIVSKRRGAPYRSGRQSWIKAKCSKSGAFPIIAFVEKLGARPRRIASFYIGRHEGDRLLYAGKVRGGFTEKEAREVREVLDPLITGVSPLSVPINKPKATWIRPAVQAEVEYNSITEDGLLRESVFKALRDDLAEPARAPSRQRALPGGVPPENILQLLPDAVVPTKDELAAYWGKVAKRALAFLGRRPLKLVRHTRGTTFYHKGPLPPVPAAVHQLHTQKREGGEGVRLCVFHRHVNAPL